MSVNIEKIINFIEEFAPLNAAEDYDNSGLIIRMNDIVEKVYLCLDINKKTVFEAIEKKTDMIISHHPILFNGIKNINNNTSTGKLITKLIKNNISVYSCHTNFDSIEKGLNYYMCKLLGYDNIRNFKQTGINNTSYSMGRVASINETTTISVVRDVLKILKQNNARLVGDEKKKISNILVSTGSLSPDYEKLIEKKIDLIITGEVKYHDALEINDNDINILELGHFGSEIIFKDYMKDLLIMNIEDIEIILSNERDIYNWK